MHSTFYYNYVKILAIPQTFLDTIAGSVWIVLFLSFLDYIYLAMSWLMEKGFCGSIVSTDETRKQCRINSQNWKIISVEKEPLYLRLDKNLRMLWGRSGHCTGSVWYLIEWNNKKILYTGDYKENSPFYFCDKIRNIFADCAVIDCAYGNREIGRSELERKFPDEVSCLIKDGKTILFPVPDYGRGFEIIQLLYRIENKMPIYIDQSLFMQAGEKDSYWTVKIDILLQDIKKWQGEPAILFVSDPQLCKKENYELAVHMANMGRTVLPTGHVYPGTGSKRLLEQKLARQILYSVHMNYSEVCSLVLENRFSHIVLNHHAGEIDDNEKITSDIKTGDVIFFKYGENYDSLDVMYLETANYDFAVPVDPTGWRKIQNFKKEL